MSFFVVFRVDEQGGVWKNVSLDFYGWDLVQRYI